MLRAVGGSTTKIYPLCQEAFHIFLHLFVHSIPNYLFDKKRSSRPPWTSKATTKVPSFRTSVNHNLYLGRLQARFVLGGLSDFHTFPHSSPSPLRATRISHGCYPWLAHNLPVSLAWTILKSILLRSHHLTDITIIHLKDPTGMTYMMIIGCKRNSWVR